MTVRRTLVIVPAQVKVREEYFYTYSCRKCEKENDHTPLQQARIPAVIPGPFASPEAIAHIMAQKFVMHSPLYRQAQEPTAIPADIRERFYADNVPGDYHDAFYAEIVAAYIAE